MVLNMPCPRCESEATLQKFGAEVQGHAWAVCVVCKADVLVRLKDGAIIRIGKA